jgi:predicted Zn-dependent protease
MSIAVTYVDSFGIPRCGCPDFNLDDNSKKWAMNKLSYCVVNRDTDLAPEVWDGLIKEAFDSWSKDFNGQLLMKFDTDEIWITDPSKKGTLLKNVAAHEIGHILGLSHSSVEGALMAPYYAVDVNRPQFDDDVKRIQSLYGSPS